MPLISINSFRDLLACPRCGSPLKGSAKLLSCSEAACAREYPSISEPPVPVLIDGNVSIIDIDSLLKRDAASPVRRKRGRVEGIFYQFLKIRNDTAEQCIEQMVKDITAETAGRPKILIVGGGEVGNGIESLYTAADVDLLAFDIYANANCQVIADAHQIPLATGSIDGVVIQAVLEHVLNPQLVVDEIYRVLRPGGLVYADTPFLQPVHEGPYDFTRFTESGHRYLFRHFAVRRSGASGGVGMTLLWILMVFGRGIHPRVGQIVRIAFWWLPRFDHWLDAKVTIDGACSSYFYGHSTSKPISATDIITYYSGKQQ